MKISELASLSKVPAKTIRYYEQIELLSPAHRAENGYRHYDSKDVEALVFIRRCRELNIALDDIRQLIDAQQNPKASCASIDEIIIKQLNRIQQTQRELAMLEVSLSNLISSCENHRIEDCSILHQLKSI